jgi:hypothetical protein
VVGSNLGTQVDFQVCYREAGGDLQYFAGADYMTSSVKAPMVISSTLSRTFSAGTYSIGLCLRNVGANPLDDNDYVNGVVTVYE